jgi:sugar-specific transcriptional regulator TrmB
MKEESPLLVLDVSIEEQKVYEFLLANPGSTAPDVARETRWTSRRAGHVLKSLEAKGMVNCLPERTPRYLPTPPEVALDLLTTRKQEELQRARVIAQRWQAKVRQAPFEEQPIEIITGREAISHMFQHMHRRACQEMLCLERPPYVISPTYHYFAVQQQAMARGVVLRNIIDASVLDSPGKAEALRKEVADGENIRVLANLPMKLVIADRRTALIPLTLEQARDIALVLRPSLLLDALCELFEILWERGTPFGTAAVSVRLAEKNRRSIDVDRLVSLLAAGMNDKSISQELGISARTLERRILELATHLGARTRFQAGWQAALRTVSAGALRKKD